MAATASIHRFEISLSDVDRSVYEALDLRVARHPSETLRYMVTRTLAYCLSWEEGIAFSKGGISQTDDPPIAVHDPTGAMQAWIDVGSPSAERMHRATRAAPRVALFTAANLDLLRKEMASRNVHRLDQIETWWLEPSFLDAIEAKVERHTRVTLTRDDGKLYLDVGGESLEGTIERVSLA
jgi:uncharacterized protein YaeQ